jgi:hypothetical protein
MTADEEHRVTIRAGDRCLVVRCSCGWYARDWFVVLTPSQAWQFEQHHRREVGAPPPTGVAGTTVTPPVAIKPPNWMKYE